MKTFKNIAYTFAALAFFLSIINNFNIAGFAMAGVFYLCGIGLKNVIRRESKQVISK